MTRVRWPVSASKRAVRRGRTGCRSAAAAIVTVPVGVLKAGAVAFTPALPEAARTALDGLSMGAYTKIGLRLDPARLDGSALGDAVSAATGGPTMYFEMQPFGRSLAVANLCNEHTPWSQPLSSATNHGAQRIKPVGSGVQRRMRLVRDDGCIHFRIADCDARRVRDEHIDVTAQFAR